MRLGATFFRRKELVEPAVDLAKEMDCIEAAIFRVICACVLRVFLWWWFWIFPRLSLFFSRKEIFHLTSRGAFLGCQNLKNVAEKQRFPLHHVQNKRCCWCRCCWYCLRWWETESSDSLFISSGRSDCDSSDDVNDSDGDDGFFYFFFFFNPLLFRF